MFFLYTSVFGAFEEPWPPLRQSPSIHTELISDADESPSGWSKKYSPSQDFGSPRLNNRHHKMLHYTSLSPQGVSVMWTLTSDPSTICFPFSKHSRNPAPTSGCTGTTRDQASAMKPEHVSCERRSTTRMRWPMNSSFTRMPAFLTRVACGRDR